MGHAANAAMRRANRARRIPDGATCACGYAEAVALHRHGAGWQCYRCAQVSHGKASVEDHHILGRAIDSTTISLPANLHRELTDMQHDLPPEIRDASDPLALTILLLKSVQDFFQVVARKLGSVLSWLLRLWEVLRERFGLNWRDALGLPPLAV
jgi:hypothetical protein